MWLLGLPVGVLLGAVIDRGDFCMHSAMREGLARRGGPNLRAYLIALAGQLVAVNLLGLAGWLAISPPAVGLLSATVGGLAFGAGMIAAKG